MPKLIKNEILIIMPVMNCLDYTKQTIASIKSKIGYDLLVVDNNSKDGTFEWLIHQQKLGALKVFTSAKNLGVARSWNLGLEFGMLTGGYKYFVILNNDLILNPKCIDEMIKALRLQKADLVSGIDNSFMFDDPFEILKYESDSPRWTFPNPDFSCFALTPKLVNEVGYFDENFYPAYFEDNDYQYRCLLKNKVVKKLNSAMFYHFGKKTSQAPEIKDNLIALGYDKNKIYYKMKWGGEPDHEQNLTPFGGLPPHGWRLRWPIL